MAAAEAFVDGLVYPPPAIRELVDKTASHIGKRGSDGAALEDKLRQKGAAKFNFINAADPYHAYYQYKLQQVRQGVDISAQQATQSKVEEDDGRPKVPKPPPFDFAMETPKADPVDLDIIRLTAMFTARNGRGFQAQLGQKEKSNYQFDFLQPSHSLFKYYNQLVDQYTKVINPDAKRLAKLDLQAGYGGPKGRSVAQDLDDQEERRILGRRQVLKDVSSRVEWTKWEGEQAKKREDEAEAERVAFAEIDWQDFVVVATVEFTEADDAADLPMPMSLAEVEGMSFKERKKQALQIEGRVLQTDAEEQAILQQAEEAAKLGAVEDADGMEIDLQAEAEQARQQPDQIRMVEDKPAKDVKIKSKDYVPRSKRHAKIKTTPCQICGQQIPLDEITEHVRIELLDPRWKEKQAITERNRASAQLVDTGANVADSLRRLAASREDIFNTDASAAQLKAREEEKRKQSKAREAVVWDGHVASSQLTTDRFAQASNLGTQIEAIHRAKGLAGPAAGISNEPVPHIGPAGFVAPVPVPTTATFQAPSSMSGASLSAAPQAGLVNSYTYNPSAGGVGSVAMAGNISTAANFSAAPVSRPAEEAPEGERPSKRTKVEKLPIGQYHSEQAWIESHPDPITLLIQMPVYPDNPKWQCEGQKLALENVPVTAAIGTLRDRILAKTGIPIGRQQLKHNDRLMTNTHSLATLNFDNGDVISLTLKEAKKK